MTVLTTARYVNSTGLRGDGTAFIAATIQGYYNTARKASGLLTVTTNSPGLAAASSQYAINAPGEWLINMNGQFSAAATLRICRNGTAVGNIMAASGSVVNPNVTIQRTFEVGDTIVPQWVVPGAMVGGDDLNYLSFTYFGPV